MVFPDIPLVKLNFLIAAFLNIREYATIHPNSYLWVGIVIYPDRHREQLSTVTAYYLMILLPQRTLVRQFTDIGYGPLESPFMIQSIRNIISSAKKTNRATRIIAKVPLLRGELQKQKIVRPGSAHPKTRPTDILVCGGKQKSLLRTTGSGGLPKRNTVTFLERAFYDPINEIKIIPAPRYAPRRIIPDFIPRPKRPYLHSYFLAALQGGWCHVLSNIGMCLARFVGQESQVMGNGKQNLFNPTDHITNLIQEGAVDPSFRAGESHPPPLTLMVGVLYLIWFTKYILL